MRDMDEAHDIDKMDLWAKNLSRIDAQILQFAAQSGPSFIDDIPELERQVCEWFDTQELDHRERTAWQSLRGDDTLLRTKLRHRCDELLSRGQLNAEQPGEGSSG